MNQEQDFLKELDEKLWKSAEKMRSSMDAANYKHIALGLIFLKYVSDSFEERQQDLRKLFQDNRPENIYYLPREDYNSDSEYAEAIEAELELLEYYQEKNVIWVPPHARWKYLQETAALPIGSVLWKDAQGNPPFNIKDWWQPKLEGDARWKYGTPPQGNANFGWMQHMLHHLAPTGSMALLLANGSMSSNTNNEGDIRKNLIEKDLVECMVALPGQLFTNTQIPACIWFLTKDKTNGLRLDQKKRNRSGETLFIDARNLGFMKDRVLRDFTADDIAKIVGTFHAWQMGEGYKDEAGFCFSAKLEDMAKHDFVLTPGRYVGSADQEEDNEPFAEKMSRLTAQLSTQFETSDRLEQEIKKNLAGLGFNV